ncbi:MAG: type II secretion system F family protein [Acidimicrobiia bacterium]
MAGRGPLTQELRRALHEMQIGVPRGEALRRLADRNDVSDLRTFVTAVTQAEDYGLPIAHVLRVQSSEMRTRRRQRAEELALKIPVKMVFPLVLCIFPTLFIVLLGPAAIRISETLFGP